MSTSHSYRITRLEAALLAVLAMNHPKRVDAIEAFTALWRIKYIPTPDLQEGMVMLVEAMSKLEEIGYGDCQSEGDIVWYALTPSGAKVTVGDPDIEAAAIFALMSHSGGKPC
ncbi:MAG: hypothetical protein ACJ71W_21855 [Terriglobales bacterium]